jgi:hypothetical protein
MEQLVRTFCANFAPVDDAVLNYLVGVIGDSEADDIDLEDVEEIVSGFFPAFAALSDEDSHEKIWKLIQEV